MNKQREEALSSLELVRGQLDCCDHLNVWFCLGAAVVHALLAICDGIEELDQDVYSLRNREV